MQSTSRFNFWERAGLQKEDKEMCLRVIMDIYGGRRVEEFTEQGFCSVTLVVSLRDEGSDGDDEKSLLYPKDGYLIVQLRPLCHALDPSITRAAKLIYPSFAPGTRSLNLQLPGQLQAYEMEMIHGTPLSRFQRSRMSFETIAYAKRERLVMSFAKMVAQGWQSTIDSKVRVREMRADSPMEIDVLSQCTGKVGTTIVHKLDRLSKELSDQWLKQRAKDTLNKVQQVFDYPVTLNHGDLIPPNILIDEATWSISGLVDWAEAEYLPFGTCLYGLENLLGHLVPISPSPTSLSNDSSSSCNSSAMSDAPTFVYFDSAPQLRNMFWTRLLELAKGLKGKRGELKVMRDMGVLLWYGYAWNEGAIDRVVNEVDDKSEITCLRAFLSEA